MVKCARYWSNRVVLGAGNVGESGGNGQISVATVTMPAELNVGVRHAGRADVHLRERGRGRGARKVGRETRKGKKTQKRRGGGGGDEITLKQAKTEQDCKH